jgi:hypothetical protein
MNQSRSHDGPASGSARPRGVPGVQFRDFISPASISKHQNRLPVPSTFSPFTLTTILSWGHDISFTVTAAFQQILIKTMTPPSDVVSPKIRFQPYGKHKHPNLGLRNDLVCAFGELLGTGMFLFLALGGSNFAGALFPTKPVNGSQSGPESNRRSILIHRFVASTSYIRPLLTW